MRIVLYLFFTALIGGSTLFGVLAHTIKDLQHQVEELEAINKHSESDIDFAHMSLHELSNYSVYD